MEQVQRATVAANPSTTLDRGYWRDKARGTPTCNGPENGGGSSRNDRYFPQQHAELALKMVMVGSTADAC